MQLRDSHLAGFLIKNRFCCYKTFIPIEEYHLTFCNLCPWYSHFNARYFSTSACLNASMTKALATSRVRGVFVLALHLQFFTLL